MALDRRLRVDERFEPFQAGPALDIVVWRVRAETAEDSSRKAQQIFDKAAEMDLHLALVQLAGAMFERLPGALASHSNELVTCLRSVLMKPEHEVWLDAIWERLMTAAKTLQD